MNYAEAPWFEKKENHPSDLYETTNSLAKFFCKAKGEPKPEVKWFKNGEPLRIGTRKLFCTCQEFHHLILKFKKMKNQSIYRLF